jgi:hypothetical protein
MTNPTTTDSAHQLRPGDRFTYRGQEYSLLAFQKDPGPGRQTVRLLLQTRCADCGAPFRMTAPLNWHAEGVLRRRCDTHKAPPWARPVQAGQIRAWRADDAQQPRRACR